MSAASPARLTLTVLVLALLAPKGAAFLAQTPLLRTPAHRPPSVGLRGGRAELGMSLFPTGSGVAGAVTRGPGSIRVDFPSVLDNSDPFVLDTMTERVPTKIVGRTVEYNKDKLGEEALKAMGEIGEEMKGDKQIRLLTKGPNMDHWNACLKPWVAAGTTWGKLPWYVGETYVYHRLLEASGYFEEGEKGHAFDIFAAEKADALALAMPQVEARSKICADASGRWDEASLTAMVKMSLWGNQGDSSLFTIQDMAAMGGEAKSDEGILVDDASDAWNALEAAELRGGGIEIHFLNDNAGLELVSDLMLSHFLLSSGKVQAVSLHLKPYPFFVSDAIEADVRHTVSVLASSKDAETGKIGTELQGMLDSKKLRMTTQGPLNLFLASPEPMWCMDAAAREVLKGSTLTIAKGDLMYRKLLGDLTFEPTEFFEEITSYFPSPLLALRTCKSPVAVGMIQDMVNDLKESHPTWMVDGQKGMIQFSSPPPITSVKREKGFFQVEFDAKQVEEEWKALAESNKD